MIFGIGNDLVSLERMARVHQRQPKRFAKRLLSAQELSRFEALPDHKRLNFLAKRWAAKEALGKALGTGIVAPVLLPAITVTHTAQGRPGLALSPALQAFVETDLLANQGVRLHLSLSDEQHLVQAFVIVEVLPRH